jgi:hypothetical protein
VGKGKLRIAIAGAGMTGAYLYKLLPEQYHDIDIFDRNPGTHCGITPCAWGTSRGFTELVKSSGLDPTNYILKRTDHVMIDGLRIPADLMTFDKSRLISDLLIEATVKYELIDTTRYDRIIDATGVARAFLPPLQDDIILRCMQYRIETTALLENRIQLGKIGYGWTFPLAGNEYHIGCGSLIADPHRIIDEIGWLRDVQRTTRCACTGEIRLSAPRYSQPFVFRDSISEIWGVGEAIGCVAPLAGDGIVPGMRSVQLLIQWWNDPAGYTRAILKEFHWMEKERQVINKLKNCEHLTLRDAWVLKKNARRMGMQVGLTEAAALLRHLK